MLYDKNMKNIYECLRIAQRIAKQHPWNTFSDLDFFELKAYGQESIYVSILGNAKNTYGLCFYQGDKAFNDLLILVDNPEIPPLQKVRYQDAIVVYFDAVQDMEPADLNLLKEADIKLTKKQMGASLRRLKQNIPSKLSDAELLQLVGYLSIFEKALERFQTKLIRARFEEGELLSYRQTAKGDWRLRTSQLKIEYHSYTTPLFDFYRAKNLNPKRIEQQIEMDVAILDALIDEEGQEPYLARAVLVASVNDEMMLTSEVLERDIDINEVYLDALMNFVEEHGRPSLLIVRDYEALAALEQLANILDIPIAAFAQLQIIDDFIEQMHTLEKQKRFN